MSGADGAVTRLLAGGGGQPRADARRNVARLVDAARAAVAEVGVQVTAHEIARRAGVGVGTFYRRLPSREALLEAVLADVIDEMLALARECLRDPDPWRGFRRFAVDYVQLRVASCGLNEALGEHRGLDLDPALAELRGHLERLVTRAVQAGAMRADVRWPDVAFLLASAVPEPATIGLRAEPEQWRRNLDVILDGLAAPTSPFSSVKGRVEPGVEGVR
ncbi:TetR/AcrR family transcriptional regulator [Pseudonocardia acaciae]|uniref:TetR/AcrR family transcriptional regulator n=1 Tax=Pseudonocardia acaciae TaxID=551276 RepID=UPI0007E8C339|nr:TetR/AcrR family transcriptional regulator [Pseudonocardia acaciae]